MGFAASSNPQFGTAITMGQVDGSAIWEASGILVSQQNPGILWTHNDSGYPGSIFAIRTNGAIVAHWTVPGVSWGDFEDISFGPGPDPRCDYIYLGDIGDNYASRPEIHIYRFPEPSAYAHQGSGGYSFAEGTIAQWETITLFYPDSAHNAEGMLVDPISGDLFIFTKGDTNAGVYRATRAELDSGEPVTLTNLRQISFRKVSAADITRDGSIIALRRGGTAAGWKRTAGVTVDDAVAGNSFSLPLATEPNGEAIGFTPTGDGYFTISEGYNQPVYFYPRTDTVPPQPHVFVPANSTWFYDDSGFEPDPDWNGLWYYDDLMAAGTAPLGYNSAEATTVSWGIESDKVITTYFRKHFSGAALANVSELVLRVCYNDGIAIYINGTEVMRRNLSPSAQWDTLANRTRADVSRIWNSFSVSPSLLREDDNVIAVEVHRADHDGPNLNFDLQLAEGHMDALARISGSPQIKDGKITLHITGAAGRTVSVLASSDFVTWSPIGMVTLVNGQADFVDPAASGTRFYRVPE